MRVTDLARKLDIKTADLRERLSEFGVASDAKDMDVEKAHEIEAALKGAGDTTRKKEAEAEDEGPMLMGMMFDDDEDEEEEEPEEEVAEEEEDDDTDDEEEDDEDESEEEEEEGDEKLSFTLPTEAAQKPAEQKAATPAATPKRNADDARARWAAAKAASEKIAEAKEKRPQNFAIKGAFRDAPTLPDEPVAPRPKKQKKLEVDRTGEKKKIQLGDTVTVREYAQALGVSPIHVVAELLKNGVMVNLNASIDFDTASIVAEHFWAEVERDVTAVSGEDLLKGNITKLLEDEPGNLSERPPVVAVMGHVDHGKTTLLDAIRKANVVSGEAGGITQHIGAYQTEAKGRKITFLDTPGHEAFTAMRARGARATDIAILVCAADDGVKPQTIEAINHAKDAGVPIIVAITKVDKEGANVDRVKGELVEHELTPSDWGGDIEMVPVAAPTGQGIDEILDIILLTNDVEPVKGNPNRPAVGTIIESHLDKSLGPVATVLVNTGTLNVGDNFIIGPILGRVKRMVNDHGKNVKVAGPGTPVLIAGLGSMPERGVGEILQAFPDTASAKKKADEFAELIAIRERSKVSGMSQFVNRLNKGGMKELKIVLKADVEGSLEAIRASLDKIENPDVQPKIIHGGVGDVTETDVLMAAAADGLLLAFHVKAPAQVQKIADREGVTIRRHTIIYKLLEEIEKMLTGMLDPEEIETDIGELEVRGIFYTKTKEQIIGGLVTDGRMEQSVQARLYRGEEQIGELRIASVQKGEEKVKEVQEGHECGLKVEMKNLTVEMGDRIVAWKKEVIEKTL